MVGLSSHEANLRLKQYGPNDLETKKSLPGLIAFLARFKNPLVIILVLAASLSAFLGDIASFAIIVIIVLLSVILDFFNTYRSEKAAQALKERVRVLAEVMRDGTWQLTTLSNLVPGDIVKLSAGKLIPADGKLVEGNNLYINEAALTGESFPQMKAPGDSVYLGSSVTSGGATMTISATGKSTKFSKIAEAIEGQSPPTEFDREIRDFSILIAKITFGLVVFIFIVNLILRHGPLNSLLFSLALAVGLTPELLPLIITLNLSKGSLAMARHGVIVKNLSAIQNLGSMDILCTDKTGTLTEDKIALVKYLNGLGEISEEVLLYSYLTCTYSTAFENPLDRAIKEFRHLSEAGYTKLKEIPFDFERKRESVVVKHAGEELLITKGAPEEIIRISNYYHRKQPMNSKIAKLIEEEYQRLSGDGFRVLAVATREMSGQADYGVADETDMSFQGFVAFLDPAKKSVGKTLQQMHEHDVEAKIITGDNALVSQKIATDINLTVKGVATGVEIDKLSDTELGRLVEKVTIFARVNPEQKMRIIQALQQNGHVVGYMGDGINDAPSLKAADVGVSVNNAVDVAKDTADLILLHKSLAELIEGVIEGRKTYANTLKYLMMGLSSNFGNMFSMAGASIFLPFLPMRATQILFNNLLYDASQFAIPTDNVDPDNLKQPRKLDMKSLKKFMWVFGPLSSLFDFTTFGVLLLVFHFGETSFQTGWFIESLLTQTFVVYIIRTKRIPFIQSWPSTALLISTLAVVGIAFGVITSNLGHYFKFQVLPLSVISAIALIVAVYLVLAQIVKYEFYKRVVM